MLGGGSTRQPFGRFFVSLQIHMQVGALERCRYYSVSEQGTGSSLNKVPGSHLVLQVDILKTKLDSGIDVSKFVKSYGKRPNEFETVSRCAFTFTFNARF